MMSGFSLSSRRKACIVGARLRWAKMASAPAISSAATCWLTFAHHVCSGTAVQRVGAVGSGEDVGHDLIDDLPQVAHQRLILLGRDRLCSAHAHIDAGDAVRAHALPWVEAQPAVCERFTQEMERAQRVHVAADARRVDALTAGAGVGPFCRQVGQEVVQVALLPAV